MPTRSSCSTAGGSSPVGRHDQLLDTSPLYREFATHQLLAA
jgi:hypothetical protein